MRRSALHYFPLALPFFLTFIIIFAVLVGLIEIGTLEYAYAKMGVDRHYIFTLLFLSLLGSYVNIPIAELPAEPRVLSGHEVTFFGMRFNIPMVPEGQRTVIAVNLGGAVIPTLLSIHLIAKNGLCVPSLVGVVIVAAIVHAIARPIKGVGIAVPTFVPPLVAAGVALLLSRESAAPLAYISGSVGTLLGADLLNLGKIQGLGAPVASIGGAGTFDGIFLTGILAVLLA